MLSDENALDVDGLLVRDQRPTVKRLILSLLSQPNIATLSLRQLVAWGDLLGQKPAAIRVTVGRLVKEELLKTVSRGVYTIGPKGVVLRNKASAWMTAPDRIRDWKGGWICVHTAHLGKANRRNVKKRERAFRLFGFREFVDGVWLRPDNLVYTPPQLYAELCQLGLEPDAVLLRSDVIEHARPHSPLVLWDSDALNMSYDKGIALLHHSEHRVSKQDLRTVTRETFLIGEHVIRQINADPLLPAGCVDACKRTQLVHAMKRYSKFCHPQWAEFLARSE